MWTPLGDTEEEGITRVAVTEVAVEVQNTPLKPRELMLLGHLYEGMTLKQAAKALGMSYPNAKRIVAKPSFKVAVERRNANITQRIDNGEFGAMAIFKAEAVDAAGRLAKLSRTAKNEKVYLQANLEIVRLSGLTPPKPQVTESVERLIDLMTPEEAEAFALTREWPERFKEQLARLPSSVLQQEHVTSEPEVVTDTIQRAESGDPPPQARQVSPEDDDE